MDGLLAAFAAILGQLSQQDLKKLAKLILTKKIGTTETRKQFQSILTQYEKLTFKNLKAGDMFIIFPTPGDNEGHGGFKASLYVFKKIKRKHRGGTNAAYIGTTNKTTFLDHIEVVRLSTEK